MRPRLVLVLLSLLSCFPAMAQKPDVVLVTLGAFRADRLAAFGGEPSLCPALNALSSRGTVFTRCFTPNPCTLPANASLLTGYLPHKTGLHDDGTGILAKDISTLGEELKKAGYATQAVVASSLLDDRYGLSRGFDRYDDGVGRSARRPAGEVTDRVLEAFKARKGPLFLWAHYFDTNDPYVIPEISGARKAGSPYDAAAAYLDSEVGRLLKALGTNVLVAVVADHGESLGEHGELTHGIFLFQATVAVPLILSGPGLPAGKVCGVPCSLADVAPTLLKIAGGSSPEGLDGADLGPALSGKSLPARAIPLESWMGYDRFRWSPLVAVTDGRWKWIRGRSLRFYDLDSDPREEHDLSVSPPAPALALKGRLPGIPKRAPGAAGAGSAGPVLGDLPDPYGRGALLKKLNEGWTLLSQEEFAKASALLTEVTSTDPGNPSAWFELGEALRRKGDLAEAGAALDKALAIVPEAPESLVSRGLVFLSQDQADKAAGLFERALQAEPMMVLALNPMAAFYLEKNQPEKAFPLLDRAILEGFANSDTYLIQMRVHIVQGKLEAADQDFKSAMAITSTPERTLKAAADIFMIKGIFPQGIKLYEEGIRRFPDYGPNYLTLAGFLVHAEQPEKALPLYKQALGCKLSDQDRKNVLELIATIEEALRSPDPWEGE